MAYPPWVLQMMGRGVCHSLLSVWFHKRAQKHLFGLLGGGRGEEGCVGSGVCHTSLPRGPASHPIGTFLACRGNGREGGMPYPLSGRPADDPKGTASTPTVSKVCNLHYTAAFVEALPTGTFLACRGR